MIRAFGPAIAASTRGRSGSSGVRIAACQKLRSPGGEYRSRVCGRKLAGSGRTSAASDYISWSEALGLMAWKASTLHPNRTAIPAPTFCKDMAK